MNKFARMLMQDKRNPYGSRGGYVRDRRDYEDYGDYRRGDRDYGDYRRGDRGDRDYGDYRRGDRDYADYRRGDRGDRGRDRDYDYNDYGDYRRGDRRGDRRDYGDMLFSKRDMETWKSTMKNEDGTSGAHFREEQVERVCQQAGIDCEKYGKDVFAMAMNKEYSDGVKVAKKYGVDTPEYYADLAKAFLEDKDFEGEPEEKLYLYYKVFAEKDD